MWTLTPESPILPAPPAPLAVFSEGVVLPMLAIVDYQANYLESDLVNQDWDPTTVSVTVPEPVDDVATVTLPEGVDGVDVVTIGGVVYSPAQNILSPQPGEFVPISGNRIQIYQGRNEASGITYAIVGGASATALGRSIQSVSNTVAPSLMSCFRNIDAVGDFSWSLSGESHPSGSLTLLVLGNIAAVRGMFMVGEEFIFAGIGFSVGSYSETLKNLAEYPDGLYEVSIGLKGKWEAQQYVYPVKLSPDSNVATVGPSGLVQSRCFGQRDPLGDDGNDPPPPPVAIDEECLSVQWTDAQLRNQSPQTTVSVAGLARKIAQRVWSRRRRYQGKFRGHRSATSGGKEWEIPITPETPRDAAITFMQLAEDLKRKNRCIIDYANGGYVECRRFNLTRQWSFTAQAVEISTSAPTQNSDGSLSQPSSDFGSTSSLQVKRIYSSQLGGSGGENFSFNSGSSGGNDRPWDGWRNQYAWVGISAEYPNVEVPKPKEEETKDKTEDDPIDPRTARARWTPREPVRQRVVIDPEKARRCPSDVRWVESVTVNASQSGRTLERIEKFTEDGFPTREVKTIYGFRFDTGEPGIVVPSKETAVSEGNVYYNETEYDVLHVWGGRIWRIIERVETNYIYDEYGYLLKIVKSGYRWLRAKEETDGLELYGEIVESGGVYTPQQIREMDLFRYRQVSLRGESQYQYRMFWDFYKDFEEEPRGQYDKVCNPDGTSSEYWLENPNWAPAVFQSESLEYESCYTTLPNPENADLIPGDIQVPDVPLGKESQSRTRIQILPSKNTKPIEFDFDGEFTIETQKDDDSEFEMEDRYIVYASSDIAMNGSFNDKAVDVQIQTQEGRPQPAQRKPPLFELVKGPKKEEDSENPEDPLTQGKDSSKDKFRYTLTTAGYSPTRDPIQGSKSWPYCETIAEIMWAAKIDLQIQDLQSSAQFSFEIAPNYLIRPYDRVTLRVNDEIWPVRPTQIQNRIILEGGGNYRSTPTQISAGFDRELNFSLNRIPSDKSKKSPGSTSLSLYRKSSQTIGEIKPPNLRSRYNVNGDT